MPFQNETLILGSGPCAEQVAIRLTEHGIPVRRAAADRAGQGTPDTSYEAMRLLGCRGQAGAFQVALAGPSRRVLRNIGSIVVAQPCLRLPNHRQYGLAPSGRIMSLSAFEDALQGGPLDILTPVGTRVAFLNAWSVDPHPVMTRSMLLRCLELQKASAVDTFFLCGNLKVSEDGMEACYEAAKKAGTLFLKFTRRFPELATLSDGRVQIDYWDETTRMDFRVTVDLVIVDEQLAPHPDLADIIGKLRLESDSHGFAQSDNVHRLPNATNRRGIFAAGGARALMSAAALTADADHVALNVLEFLAGVGPSPQPRVEIDQGRCARCLTCYRLCPYAAIEMEPRMTIDPAACQSCGLCTAGCPNRAIQIDDPDLESALKLMTDPAPEPKTGTFVPRMAAFCCSRSAVQARDLAKTAGHGLPGGIVFVEGICGGTFAVRHLLSAFEAGMDGVLVLTCHEGNCHSERGTTEAAKRVAEAIRLISWAGITAERVQFNTLAANMGVEFAQVVNGFAERIRTLGPAMG